MLPWLFSFSTCKLVSGKYEEVVKASYDVAQLCYDELSPDLTRQLLSINSCLQTLSAIRPRS